RRALVLARRFQEGADFVRFGERAAQVEAEPAEERGVVAGRRGLQVLSAPLRLEEGVDGARRRSATLVLGGAAENRQGQKGGSPHPIFKTGLHVTSPANRYLLEISAIPKTR